MTLKAILLALCIATLSYSQQNCLGYDASLANIAAQYASCSSVTTDFLSEISSWNYTYCTNAQS
jgi:hypothetical protein